MRLNIIPNQPPNRYDNLPGTSQGYSGYEYKEYVLDLEMGSCSSISVTRHYKNGVVLSEPSGHSKRVQKATIKQWLKAMLPWEQDLCFHGLVGRNGRPPAVSMYSRNFQFGFAEKAKNIDAHFHGKNITHCKYSSPLPRIFKLLVGSGLVLGGVALVITGLFASQIIMFVGVGVAGVGILWFACLIVRNQTTGRGLPIFGARVGDLVHGLRDQLKKPASDCELTLF